MDYTFLTDAELLCRVRAQDQRVASDFEEEMARRLEDRAEALEKAERALAEAEESQLAAEEENRRLLRSIADAREALK